MIDPEGFHGVNESLNLKDYNKTIGFYVDFIKGFVKWILNQY
jgi:acetylornithine deacetylase/succinyl-diaminopimelate desuccinylase-like protein